MCGIQHREALPGVFETCTRAIRIDGLLLLVSAQVARTTDLFVPSVRQEVPTVCLVLHKVLLKQAKVHSGIFSGTTLRAHLFVKYGGAFFICASHSPKNCVLSLYLTGASTLWYKYRREAIFFFRTIAATDVVEHLPWRLARERQKLNRL